MDGWDYSLQIPEQKSLNESEGCLLIDSEKLEDSAKRVVEHAGDRAHDGRDLAIGDVLGSADRLCNEKVNQTSGERGREDPDDPRKAEAALGYVHRNDTVYIDPA